MAMTGSEGSARRHGRLDEPCVMIAVVDAVARSSGSTFVSSERVG